MDCSYEFKIFLEKIELPNSKIDNLRQGRDALRERIEKYYSDQEKNQPVFCWQGSFSMKTTINQVKEDYDLDDGVYLKHLPKEKKEWPSTEDVHEEIINAVDGQTSLPIENKNACVRVHYKSGYHIDLAIYCEDNDKIYLARLGDAQWEENNPKEFKDWFDEKIKKFGDQYRSLCKYIKKWAYYNGYSDEITGFNISILVGNNMVSGYEKDDEALVEILKNIVTDLETNGKIIRPIKPYKNMTEKYSDTEFKEKILDRFKKFKDIASTALYAKSKIESCDNWIKLFGDDFPSAPNEKNDTMQNIKEVKPWGMNP